MTTEHTSTDQAAQPLGVSSSEGLGPAPRWWHCDTHGPGNYAAWGCPECVREMRGEIARLVSERDAQRAKLLPLLGLAQEVLSIAAHGCLLDGDEVNTPTRLWAEEWQRRISGPNGLLKGAA
jgi:hypothetical protein